MSALGVEHYSKPKKTGEGGSSGLSIYNYNGNGVIGGNEGNFTDLYANKATIDKFNMKTGHINDAKIDYLASDDGTINKLRGDELNYKTAYIGELESDKINSNEVKTDKIQALEGIIGNLLSTNITTDYLTVTKSAHFFELIIDKIRSVGGTIMCTAANCEVFGAIGWDASWNTVYNSLIGFYEGKHISDVRGFAVYWRHTDELNKTISNDFLVNDQVICQSFNNVHVGVNNDAGNKYYWRLCTRVDEGVLRYVQNQCPTDKLDYDSPLDYDLLCDSMLFETNTGSAEGNYNIMHFNISGEINGIYTPYIIDGVPQSHLWHFTPADNVHGIVIEPAGNGTLTDGTFSINMHRYGSSCNESKLNIGVYYDDDTYEFHPYNEKETELNEYGWHSGVYSVDIPSGKSATKIVITCGEIVKWHACNWMDLSNVSGEYDVPTAGASDWSQAPSENDNLVQLGYRYGNDPTQDDIARASAIIIAAYKTPDSGIVPPSYAQYRNIIDFSLSNHRHSFFDANTARFVGDFYNESGEEITPPTPRLVLPDYTFFRDRTNGAISPSTLPIWINKNGDVLTNMLDGHQGKFTFTLGSQGDSYSYIGPQGYTLSTNIPNNTTNIKVELIKLGTPNKTIDESQVNILEKPVDGAQGAQGIDGTIWELLPVDEKVEVQLNNTQSEDFETIASKLYCNLKYQFYEIVGNTINVIDVDGVNYRLRISSNVSGWYTDITSGVDHYASLERSNILDLINPSSSYADSSYRDYTQLSMGDSAHLQRCPTELKATLYRVSDNKVLDERYIPVVFKAGHVFSITDKAFKTSYQAAEGAQGAVVNLRSDFEQTAEGFQTNVIALYEGVQGAQAGVQSAYAAALGAQSSASHAEQTADHIQTVVRNIKAGADNLLKRTAFGYIGAQGQVIPSLDYTKGTGDYTDSHNDCWTINLRDSGSLSSFSGDDVKFLVGPQGVVDGYVSYEIDATGISGMSDSKYVQFRQKLYYTNNSTTYSRLKPNTWYTLAFDVVGSQGCNLVTAITYTKAGQQVNDTVIIDGVQGTNTATDNNHTWTVDTTSTRHSYTFQTSSYIGDGGTTNMPYVYFNFKQPYKIWLANIMLAEGTTDTGWTSSTMDYDYYTSKIEQTSKSIELSVYNINENMKRTGIDIEDGTITLDAGKTTITGSLNLEDAESGLVLYDNNSPVISIQNTPVGDSSSATYTIYGDDELSARTTNSVHLYIKSSTIGLISGLYSVDNMKLLTYIYDDSPDSWNITNVVANGYIYKSNNTSTPYKTLFTNKTVSGTSGSKYVDLGGPYTFTSDYTGNCYVYLDVVINFSTTITGRLFGGQTTTKITSVTNKIMKIGSDGVVFITSPNQYAMFNSTKYEFKHGTNVLTVDDNGMKRTIGSATADIGTIMPTKIIDISSSSWPVITGGWYGFVVYTGSYTGVSYVNDEIEDPSSDNIGARYTFKNLSNLDVYLHTGNNDTIIHPDETTPRTGPYDNGWARNKTYRLEVGEIITMFSDGTHWNIFSGTV